MATERDYFHDLAEDLVHGAEESYVADLSEEMLDLLEQGMASEDRWAVMAMRCREAAMGVWARHTGAVTSQCERAFTRALEREDEAIVSSLASEFSAPTGLTNRAANEVMEASRGLAEIISRQNVALADNLADTWWRVTADAVTRTQLGDDPRDVMEDAVSFLSKAGLETIDYRSGQKTSIDAAVRRHTITQANQCRNDMLVRQCEAYEVDLVFTSAHWGCRPTHAEWQGKPFSLHGTVEVDGVTYRDLAEATGYGTVWGLCGANCRHRLTPFLPGLSKLPDTDFSEFEKKYHMTSEEYYRATQRQRALERQVRATKREIALGQERGLDMTEARYRLGAQQKRLRDHCARTGLPRDGERERAYGVREQPRALSSQLLVTKRADGIIQDAKPGTSVKGYSSSSIRSREGFKKCNWAYEREYGVVYNAKGKMISDVFVGDGGSVQYAVPEGFVWKDCRVVHTHPGIEGGTLSADDVFHLVDADLLSIEAVAREGVYSLFRTSEVPEASRRQFSIDFSNQEDTSKEERYFEIRQKYIDAGLYPEGSDYEAFSEEVLRAMHSDLHGWLLSHAADYGYSYEFKPSKRR